MPSSHQHTVYINGLFNEQKWQDEEKRCSKMNRCAVFKGRPVSLGKKKGGGRGILE